MDISGDMFGCVSRQRVKTGLQPEKAIRAGRLWRGGALRN